MAFAIAVNVGEQIYHLTKTRCPRKWFLLVSGLFGGLVIVGHFSVSVTYESHERKVYFIYVGRGGG